MLPLLAVFVFAAVRTARTRSVTTSSLQNVHKHVQSSQAACTFFPTLHTRASSGPLSGTTRVSWYQKGKTNLDFTEARDSEWQWHQLGRTQVCTSLQTDNHASTPPLSFLQAGCPSCRPTNSVNAPKALQLFPTLSIKHCDIKCRNTETLNIGILASERQCNTRNNVCSLSSPVHIN